MNATKIKISYIFKYYFKFLVLEIPNIIQILSSITFGSVFINNSNSRMIFLFIICFLFSFYILFKGIDFLLENTKEIVSQLALESDKYANIDKVYKWWTIFMVTTGSVFILLAIKLIEIGSKV